ncbi:hypothetical protein [Sphingomicrobium sp. B8]|uniref:Phage shock protein B n=1 Tax=Sphingomicrobium clamense TaxID=2851013 RepID=A0ABS6V763_9SPHN|nr:hypothetical protein [Sphingomicrobium sp. B8]MBW0145027.1 hypothetical protein [Sphingomicrobium sp. B8]
MGVFEMIVGVVLIGTAASIINRWIAAKHGYEYEDETDTMKKIAPVEDPATEKRIQALEKRVRVLERIATDEGARLASEIEALQDAREDDLSDALSTPRFKTRETS